MSDANGTPPTIETPAAPPPSAPTEAQVAAAASTAKIASKAESKLRLGEILLKYTSLSQIQLEQALEIQKSEGGLLGEILIQRNMILPHEIMRALCMQLRVPYLEDIKSNDIDPSLVDRIPINYAKTKECIPIEKKTTINGEQLIVAVTDPFNPSIAEDLRVLTGLPVQTVVTTSMKVQDAINRVYEKNTGNLVEKIDGDFDENYDLEGPIDILEATENDAPVIKFVNSILFRAVKEKASDIHIEPYEKEFVVRFRVDGVLKDIIRQPKRAHAAISSRIKVMGQLDIAEKRLPQDGRIKIRLAGKDVDFRLSTVPVINGERVVLRILADSGGVIELEKLGFPPKAQTQLVELISKKYGIILVTGPTGHGKSTTLSSLLSKINNPEKNILTVEDPIEYQIAGVNQVQVNSKIGLNFARALRAFLRQNPDVIMVGEIRDKETAEISINASLTGHLVLSTLHTNDAPGAVTRLIDMGVEPFLVASSLLGVEAQRLIRRLCTKCREPHTLNSDELKQLGLKAVPDTATVFKANGCLTCNHTGYSGRTVIHELLLVDEKIRSLIIRNSDAGTIKEAALANGMTLLREDGVQKVLAGITSLDELERATHAEV